MLSCGVESRGDFDVIALLAEMLAASPPKRMPHLVKMTNWTDTAASISNSPNSINYQYKGTNQPGRNFYHRSNGRNQSSQGLANGIATLPEMIEQFCRIRYMLARWGANDVAWLLPALAGMAKSGVGKLSGARFLATFHTRR